MNRIVPSRKTPIETLPMVSKRSCIKAHTKGKSYKKEISYSDYLVEERVYNIGTAANPNIPPFVEPNPDSKIEEYKVRRVPTQNVAERRAGADFWRRKYNDCFKRGIVQRFFCKNPVGEKSERFVHLDSGLILRGSEVKGVVNGSFRLQWNHPVPLNPPQADVPRATTSCSNPCRVMKADETSAPTVGDNRKRPERHFQ